MLACAKRAFPNSATLTPQARHCISTSYNEPRSFPLPEAHPMRCSLLSAILILGCTPLPAAAQEKAKPNTLTPKEIADGWILLFDGETTFGWWSPSDSKWTIIDGMIAPQRGEPGW